MSTYENGHFVPWHPDMIASKGSVLHGRNSAFVAPTKPALGERWSAYRTTPLTPSELRVIRLVIWAAKCHTHREETRMPLGSLPHSYQEVNEAIAEAEKVFGAPERHEDEGVKVRSKRVH